MPTNKTTPSYLCDVQEWISEEISENGERKKRKRLVRTIGWGVPYLVARSQQRAFRTLSSKLKGSYIKIPKYKSPEDINKERIKNLNAMSELNSIKTMHQLLNLMSYDDGEVQFFHEVGGVNYKLDKVRIFQMTLAELSKGIVEARFFYQTTKKITGNLFPSSQQV